ncbi:class I SAM-dependent methyltransferase [Enterococcus sp. AZ196]|uniref:class I SAM-dependent methyltransferase n=1 Tax=Enterococcus sp. AZ196 TaxID=2774659 RepID=UPI003D26E645
MINKIKRNVPIFSQSQDSIWLDDHLAPQMLAAHLDTEFDGATRNAEYIKRSMEWLTKKCPAQDFPQLLDLGCGPGIYAEKFFEAGYHVKGIDFSELSIAYAQESADGKKYDIDYQCGNYLAEDLGSEQYDVIVLIYCDLGVFSPEDRKRLFKKVNRALKKGGRFIFDVFTPEKYKSFEAAKTWQLEENNFWTKEACLHLSAQKRYPGTNTYLDQHYLLYPEAVKEFFIWETVFAADELLAELSACGFAGSEAFGDLRGTSYTAESETLCLVVEK